VLALTTSVVAHLKVFRHAQHAANVGRRLGADQHYAYTSEQERQINVGIMQLWLQLLLGLHAGAAACRRHSCTWWSCGPGAACAWVMQWLKIYVTQWLPVKGRAAR
jgi:hypothetical protein